MEQIVEEYGVSIVLFFVGSVVLLAFSNLLRII